MFKYVNIANWFKSQLHPHPRFDEITDIIEAPVKVITPEAIFDIVNDTIMNEYAFLSTQIMEQISILPDEEREKLCARLLKPKVIKMLADRVARDFIRNANMQQRIIDIMEADLSDITSPVRAFIQYALVPLITDVVYRRTKLTKGANSFEVPQGVRAAAQRGLELRREFGHGGLDSRQAGKLGIGSGVQRASNLVQGHVTKETIKRMYSFFSRHSAYKKYHDDKSSKAYISWMLWGGNPGFSWAKKMMKQFEREEQNEA